jgi:hypothetical protein
MPLGDSADQPGGVRGWWADLTMGMKALFAFAVVLVIAGISVGIAAAAGAFNSTESDITLRKLTYTCKDATVTPTYSAILAARGSSHTRPGWEGSLYVKTNGNECEKTYTSQAGLANDWLPLKSKTSTVPSLPSGITGIVLSMWEDATTGHYHLLADGCVTYYNKHNTNNDYTKGVSKAWPIIANAGTKMYAPECSPNDPGSGEGSGSGPM